MTSKLFRPLFVLTALAALSSHPSIAPAQTGAYRFTSLFDNTTVLPGGGTFDEFGSAAIAPNLIPLNNSGQVAFVGSRGTYTASAAGIQKLLDQSVPLPEGGNSFRGAFGLDINNRGRVAFTVQLNASGSEYGKYTVGADGVSLVARSGGAAPGGGNYVSFVTPAFPSNVNDNGDVAFWFETTPSNRGSVFVNSGGTSQRIAGFGQSAPGGGSFLDFNDININNNGDTVFDATTTGGSGYGVFKYNKAGQGEIIAARGQAAPGGGNFRNFLLPDINDSGGISFRATTTDGPAQGVYKFDGTNTSLIAATGQQLPDGQLINGIRPYTSINGSGSVAFAVTNGLTNNSIIQSLYVGNGTNLSKVIGLGDVLLGSTVTQLAYSRRMLNDNGEVVVSYVLANGRYGVALAAPSAVAAPEPGTFTLMFGSASVVMLGLVPKRKRRVA